MSQRPVEPSGTEPQQEAAGSPAHPTRPRRGSPPTFTVVLAGVAVLAFGFLGGIGVSKLAGRSTSAAPGTGAPSGLRFRSVSPGQPNAVVGTVEKVADTTVYLKIRNGKTIKVTTTPNTAIRVSKQGSADDLTKRSTVAVRGSTHGNTMSARSIDQGSTFRVRPAVSPTP